MDVCPGDLASCDRSAGPELLLQWISHFHLDKGSTNCVATGSRKPQKNPLEKSPKPPTKDHQTITLLGTNISPPKGSFEDDFPFHNGGIWIRSLEGKHSKKNTSGYFFLLAPHRLARWPTPLLGWTSEACTLCTKTWFVWIFSQLMQLKLVVSTFNPVGKNIRNLLQIREPPRRFSCFKKERVTTLCHWISNDGINFLFWQSYNLWRLKCRCLLSFRLSEVCREYGFARCCPHFPHEFPDSLWQRGMVLLMASAPVVWHSICLSDAQQHN